MGLTKLDKITQKMHFLQEANQLYLHFVPDSSLLNQEISEFILHNHIPLINRNKPAVGI